MAIDGVQYGDTLIFPPYRSFEVHSMDDGIRVIGYKKYLEWTGLNIEFRYSLLDKSIDWCGKTGINYIPWQMQIGIYAKYPIESGIYVSKKIW